MVGITVIDDDQAFLAWMRDTLATRGWTATLHLERGPVVAFIRDDAPDLVILHAPAGEPERAWQVIELLWQDPASRSIPIIVYSASLDALFDRQAWLRERAIAVLPKPFPVEDLFRTIERALSPHGP